MLSRRLLLGLLFSALRFYQVSSFVVFKAARNSFPLHLAEGGKDATDNLLAKFADAVQKVVTNSPLNEGKKAIARAIAGDYDQQSMRSKINALVSENAVLMLSFATCPFCIKAKSVLNEKNVQFKVVELDREPDGMAMRAEMAQMIGRTSVPAIWIGGRFIGGCNDGPMGGIVSLSQSGELDSMLKQAGVV